jgi:hypothetical protein
MVDAKQLETQGLSWFRLGAVRPAVVCSGHYIAQHRGCLLWGSYKQGGRGGVASKSLVKWLKMLWENWGACVWCVVCCLLFIVSCCAFVSCPLRRGSSPSFYRPRRG